MTEPHFVAGDLLFRPIGEDDVDRIVRWLADPEVGGWWEGVTVDHDEALVRRDFLAHPGEEHVTKAIVERDGRPIGFQQWYPVWIPGEAGEWGDPAITTEGTFGIDQFIGESRLHNQGIGTRQVRAVATWLLGPHGPDATRVITDPVVENLRAVRCYEKAGFRKVKVLPAHEALDGVPRDSWLMECQPGGAQAGSRP